MAEIQIRGKNTGDVFWEGPWVIQDNEFTAQKTSMKCCDITGKSHYTLNVLKQRFFVSDQQNQTQLFPFNTTNLLDIFISYNILIFDFSAPFTMKTNVEILDFSTGRMVFVQLWLSVSKRKILNSSTSAKGHCSLSSSVSMKCLSMGFLI